MNWSRSAISSRQHRRAGPRSTRGMAAVLAVAVALGCAEAAFAQAAATPEPVACSVLGVRLTGLGGGSALRAAGLEPDDVVLGGAFGRRSSCFCSALDLERIELESDSGGGVELWIESRGGEHRFVVVPGGWWQVAGEPLSRSETAEGARGVAFDRAQAARRAGEFALAAALYEESLDSAASEDRPVTLGLAALAWLGAGEPRNALARAADMIGESATDLELGRAFLLQAQAQVALQDPVRARVSAEMALGIARDSGRAGLLAVEALALLGAIEAALSDTDEALERLGAALRRVHTIWPNSHLEQSLLVTRGKILLALGRDPEAAADFFEAEAHGAPLTAEQSRVVHLSLGQREPGTSE